MPVTGPVRLRLWVQDVTGDGLPAYLSAVTYTLVFRTYAAAAAQARA